MPPPVPRRPLRWGSRRLPDPMGGGGKGSKAKAGRVAAAAAEREQRRLEAALEPVYDALDRRDDAGAARLALAGLKRCAGGAIASAGGATLAALRAVALVRSGQAEAALALCDEIAQHGHADEGVLVPLAAALREARQPRRLLRVYEAALEARPDDQELLGKAFEAQCRCFAFLRQQQGALKLYRGASEERYLLWAVVAMMLQARHGEAYQPRADGAGLSAAADGGTAPAQGKLLQLAEMMLRKRHAEVGLASSEALMVLIEVLEEQGKHAAAADLLQGDAGKLITLEADRRRLVASLRTATGDHEAAAAEHRALLEANPDDWLAIVGFIDTTLGADPGDTQLEVCERMVEQLATTAQGMPRGGKLRGPRLARCEMALRRLRVAASGGGDGAAAGATAMALADVVACYVEAHGQLASAAMDLTEYTRALREGGHTAAAEALVSRVIAAAEARSTDEALKEDERQRLLCSAHAVALDCGVHRRLAGPATSAVAAKLLATYAPAAEAAADVDARENIAADGLLICAAHVLLSAAGEMASPAREGVVLAAVAALERGCSRSSHHAEMRIALVSAYLALGCPTQAQIHWKQLDVKNIQMDTLSHHMQPAVGVLGPMAIARGVRRAILKLHSDHESGDAGDMYVLALKHGAFAKAIEMVGFARRLASSHQLADARADVEAEEALVACLTGVGSGAAPQASSVETARAGLDVMRANEDMGLRPFWDPLPGACALCHKDACSGVAGLGGRQSDLPDDECTAWRARVEQKRLLAVAARAAAAPQAQGVAAIATAHSRAMDIAGASAGVSGMFVCRGTSHSLLGLKWAWCDDDCHFFK